MDVREARSEGIGRLKKMERDAPELTAELFLSSCLGWPKHRLITEPDSLLSEEILDKYRGMIERRAAGEPTAYILGRREFFSLDFEVGPGVLIPRPETEHLVEWGLELLKNRPVSERSVLDIGTGSGNIAIALLASDPDLRAVAVDASFEAAAYARRNLGAHGLESRGLVLVGDGGQALDDQVFSFDLIVCNPPYILPEERALMSDEVLEYEPPLALFCPPEDPYAPVKCVSAWAERLLEPGGHVLVEVGAGHAEEVARLLAPSDRWKLEGIRRDLAGIERVVGATKIC